MFIFRIKFFHFLNIVKKSKKYDKFNKNYFIQEEIVGIRNVYILLYFTNVESSQTSLAKASHNDILNRYFIFRSKNF